MQARQTVYIRSKGYRNSDPYIVTEGIIESIGRKYFVVNGSQYHIDDMTLRSEYTNDTKVYLSMQEIYDHEEFKTLYRSLREVFGVYNPIKPTLEQLRKINLILKNP